jgi:hypothetical protein
MLKLRFSVWVLLVLTACDGIVSSAPFDSGVPPVLDAGKTPDDAGILDAGRPDSGLDGGPGAGLVDAGRGFCSGIFCDNFESYPTAGVTNGTTLGPWKASVTAGNGAVTIDTGKAFSGTRSLKVHINAGSAGGGQLRTKASPIFSPIRPQLYGKFRMYLQPGAGTSNHWTMFGAAGTVQPGVPLAGHHVTYLFSAFNENGNNRFGEVFYDDQTAQDCWHHSTQLMPTGRWACVGFAVNGPQIQYRVFLDGQPVPTLSLNNTGDGCLNAAATAPWYGPSFDEFYIGALSFHPMSAPLDLWIDDVVLDTNPVACE